ncbi:MAG: DUF1049 domain-containing protein [Bradyrhizobium sp.]|uniref:lipopolysaccharide assembly protein LapA domain-containing protein n=1 Tax=Bradyrhizobium sp. TaxID=376 RepID=UPI001ECD231D|nr:lipopolysaccharide assembly protein LapA domain-containing protein [Bradyrhizobium sp.]MBU6456953.1 DUF1049 domain-containing protein [Bradyrhizobium sp.]MDE2329310.1 DUF1049 domain-containing protein [Bradyrhizobium sp.]MDE2602022.1 DUF1049 domain-containing protein [Bradyrhizobium sp.]
MRKFFGAALVISLGVIFVVFAVANRHLVTVSFDPFNSVDPSLKVTSPLFLVIIATTAIGVVAGGTASWLGQRRWRRAARRFEADARQARAQLADLRASAIQRGKYRSVPALPPGGTYGASERDKQVATL